MIEETHEIGGDRVRNRREGILVCDTVNQGYDIRFGLEEYYGSLHCGSRFEVRVKGKWIPVRLELDLPDRWYYALLCGIFAPNSVSVTRYASFIGVKSPTNCDAQFAESNFQTGSRIQVLFEDVLP